MFVGQGERCLAICLNLLLSINVTAIKALHPINAHFYQSPTSLSKNLQTE